MFRAAGIWTAWTTVTLPPAAGLLALTRAAAMAGRRCTGGLLLSGLGLLAMSGLGLLSGLPCLRLLTVLGRAGLCRRILVFTAATTTSEQQNHENGSEQGYA
ncbi:MAG: hypothetical protein ABIF77_02915 [bacterium]